MSARETKGTPGARFARRVHEARAARELAALTAKAAALDALVEAVAGLVESGHDYDKLYLTTRRSLESALRAAKLAQVSK